MKKWIVFLCLLVCVLALAGCTGGQAEDAPVEDTGAETKPVAQEIPEDFSVRFSWWYVEDRKNVMDTGAGTLQKDLVTDGTASAAFEPDPAFLRQLYDLVCAEDFRSIRREMCSETLAKDDVRFAVTPNCFYAVEVTARGERYVIRGDGTAVGYTDTEPEAACFVRTVAALQKLVQELPEWAALPEPGAAYA